MGDGPDHVPNHTHPDPALCKPLDHLGPANPTGPGVEEHHVGIGVHDLGPQPREGGGQARRPGVVVDQAVHMLIEGVKGRRGHQARLAHGSAEAVLPQPGHIDGLLASGQTGTHGRPQPLGEIDPHRVGPRRPLLGGYPGSHHSVE